MQQHNQHIVFLTPGFPSTKEDSTTIPALQLFLKNLRKAIPLSKMTLIPFQYPFSTEPYTWNGIEVIPLNGKNKRYKKLWIWNKAYQVLKKIHKQNPIHLIHSFWIGECSLIGNYFAAKIKKHHIVTVMGQDAYLNNRYTKHLKHSDTTIITLSKKHHKTLTEYHSLTSQVVPWGIETSNFPPLQQKTIDILGVGSLNKIKNYTLFIEVISKLVSSYPNLKVELIGDGIERKVLEKSIIKHHLQNNIQLLGKLSRDQVLHKMAQSRIFLHTSSYESFGFVFIEALYSGMQIVSLPVGIAQSISKWSVCSSESEIIQACKVLLTQTIEKKRILLYTKNECIYAYKKLYNSSFDSSKTKD